MPGTFCGTGNTQLNQTDNILALMELTLLWEQTDKNQIYTILGSDNTMILFGDSENVFGHNKTPLTERLPASAGQAGWSSG